MRLKRVTDITLENKIFQFGIHPGPVEHFPCTAETSFDTQVGRVSRYEISQLSSLPVISGRKNVMSMRELFCPDPLARFEKMTGL